MRSIVTDEMCDCCAITGGRTPATEMRPIPAGSMQYQTSADTTTVYLCDECVKVHDECAGIGDRDDDQATV